MPDPDFDAPPPYKLDAAPQASGLAITSLVCGIMAYLTFLPCMPIGLVLDLVAVVVGHMGRAQVKRDPHRYGGSGMALAGLILGYSNAVVSLAVFAFLLVLFVSNAKNQTGPGTMPGGAVRVGPDGAHVVGEEGEAVDVGPGGVIVQDGDDRIEVGADGVNVPDGSEPAPSGPEGGDEATDPADTPAPPEPPAPPDPDDHNPTPPETP